MENVTSLFDSEDKTKHADADVDLIVTDTAENKKPKELCPCKCSSDGTSWLIPCSVCNQSWHPSCANLKGLDELNDGESERCINVIVSKGWKCPLCFSSVYARPKNHIAAKAEQTLLSKTMVAKITDNLNSTIQSTISETLEKLISEK